MNRNSGKKLTFYRKNLNRDHQKRCKILRDGWLIIALIMLTLPVYQSLVLAFLSTFLSFMFLDECGHTEARQGHRDQSQNI